MNGLYWWIDRWRKSSAFMDMTLAEQGAYRNLLDEAALRGGPLPDNDRTLAKASGDATMWPEVRKVVMRRFQLTPDGWRNATLDQMLHQADRRIKKQAEYRARLKAKQEYGNGEVTQAVTKAVTRRSRSR